MSRSSQVLLGVVGLLLAVATVFQLRAKGPGVNQAPVSIGLAERIPMRLDGWIIQNSPLGETENAEGKVKGILNYDEYVYRLMRKGGWEVGVYVAYWSPGRMPTRMIQLHTPDRCWTENGWTCNAMAFGRQMKLQDETLLPAQWRIFTTPNGSQTTHVLFWLLVSGKNYDFGRRLNITPNPVRWWGQFLKELISGYEEHYFIRLTSNRPFEEVQSDPGFQEVVAALAKLGLQVRPGTRENS